MSREYSSFFPDAQHIADTHIAASDYGMSAVSIRNVFSELRERLVPLVRSIISQPLVDNSCLHQYYPEAEQIAFCQSILKQMGYDMQRGRQDKTIHPFMTKFSIDDVRITTRFYENDLSQGIFSTIHEMGHAFYELGNAPELEGTPLSGGVSSGVHESQSRLWENLIGRSRPFWQYFYPQLQAHFPHQLGAVPLETFETGNFTVLRDWLQSHIYRHGRKFTAAETIERVSGKPISTQPLMDYFYSKYKDLYGV
jgi:carboxypeptidase Taq